MEKSITLIIKIKCKYIIKKNGDYEVFLPLGFDIPKDYDICMEEKII